MVFTHIPSNLCLILAAFAPTLRACAGAAARPRGAVADGRADALVLRHGGGDAEPERPAAASFTSVPRSLAAAASPALAGALFAASLQVLPLVICGALKIAYDLLLLIQFRHVKPPEEQ